MGCYKKVGPIEVGVIPVCVPFVYSKNRLNVILMHGCSNTKMLFLRELSFSYLTSTDLNLNHTEVQLRHAVKLLHQISTGKQCVFFYDTYSINVIQNTYLYKIMRNETAFYDYKEVLLNLKISPKKIHIYITSKFIVYKNGIITRFVNKKWITQNWYWYCFSEAFLVYLWVCFIRLGNILEMLLQDIMMMEAPVRYIFLLRFHFLIKTTPHFL